MEENFQLTTSVSMIFSMIAGIGFSGTSSGGVARRPISNAAPVSGATPVGIGVGGNETAHLGGLAGLTSSDDEGIDGHLGLGELAQLTVNNEAEVSYDVSFFISFSL